MEKRDVNLCPKCGAKTRIYNKKSTKHGVTRYRACPQCLTRYRTVETDIADNEISMERLTDLCEEMYRQKYEVIDLLRCVMNAQERFQAKQ